MMKLNTRNKADGFKMLYGIPNASTPLVFFDPQYRGGLEKLKYGNEGERQIRRAALPQMHALTIMNFGEHIDRILKPSGYVMLWLDKFELCNFDLKNFFGVVPGLQTVDLITWDKMRIGMGYRTRRRGEYCMVLQKYPILAKATWTDHGIPDVWPEKADTRVNPHRKPFELTKRLILATTRPRDLIVDPCAGSFMVLDAARATGRMFLGCDILGAPK